MIKLVIINPAESDMAEVALKAKRAFLFKAEEEFHTTWKEAMEWLKSGQVGRKTFVAQVPLLELENDGKT